MASLAVYADPRYAKVLRPQTIGGSMCGSEETGSSVRWLAGGIREEVLGMPDGEVTGLRVGTGTGILRCNDRG